MSHDDACDDKNDYLDDDGDKGKAFDDDDDTHPPQYAKMARYITHFSNHGAMATISSRDPTTR